MDIFLPYIRGSERICSSFFVDIGIGTSHFFLTVFCNQLQNVFTEANIVLKTNQILMGIDLTLSIGTVRKTEVARLSDL